MPARNAKPDAIAKLTLGLRLAVNLQNTNEFKNPAIYMYFKAKALPLLSSVI